jgi:alcohol dehydrogenase class IV
LTLLVLVLLPCLLLQALEQLRPFRPDVIIAVGGGSPMDAAKLMWLMYEQPGTKFEEVAARFMVRGAAARQGFKPCCCWVPGCLRVQQSAGCV